MTPSDPAAAAAAGTATVDLLGALAYGELTAFERLATDARMAPTLGAKAALAGMAVAEFDHYRRLRDHLEIQLGVPGEQAMGPFVAPLNAFHDLTRPSDWLESLVKAYVGDGIAADFYREISAYVDPATRALVLEVLADTGHATFAVEHVVAAIKAEPSVGGRLALWARRLVGEALTQAQRVAAERDALADLLTKSGDLSTLVALFTRITESHQARMAALGLGA